MPCVFTGCILHSMTFLESLTECMRCVGRALPSAELAQPWQALQQNWATQEQLALKTEEELAGQVSFVHTIVEGGTASARR